MGNVFVFRWNSSLIEREHLCQLNECLSQGINRSDKSLLSEAFTRYCIIKSSALKNGDIAFMYQEHGKPFLKSKPLHFNVSHSGEFFVCVTSQTEVGIDIQQIKSYSSDQIIHLFFTKDEKRFILNAANKNTALAEVWVLKESYLKLLGVGLHKPLTSFCVRENKENKQLFSVIDDDETKHVSFVTHTIANNYKLAICSFSNSISDKLISVELNTIVEEIR